jgi:CheY-like chemotaxis protein
MAKVLIVDDAHLTLQIMYYQLSKMNHIVIMANNGLEAMNIMKENPVDLVITDINMPILDGLDLLDLIRSHEQLQQIPVIVVTASAKRDLEHLARRKGARGFLTQPFSSSDLDKLMSECLEEKNGH